MTQRSRNEQRDHLMTSLGMLVDPIRRLIDVLDSERSRVPYIESQFTTDILKFNSEVESYCKVGHHNFTHEYFRVRDLTNHFVSTCFGCAIRGKSRNR